MDCSSIIESLHRLDQSLTLALNSLDHPLTDQFWIFMSDKLVWAPAYFLCVVFLVKRLGWKRSMVVVATVLLAFLLCDQLSNLSKNAVGRLRPNYSSEMLSGGLNVLERRGGKFGFFSAHAANTFSMAVCLSMGLRGGWRRFRIERAVSSRPDQRAYRGFAAGVFIWAALVSLSRVFVGKHYLGDVLVGTIAGLLIGWAMGSLGRLVIRRFLEKDKSAGV